MVGIEATGDKSKEIESVVKIKSVTHVRIKNKVSTLGEITGVSVIQTDRYNPIISQRRITRTYYILARIN